MTTIDKIKELAAQADDFGKARGWSRAKLIREYPALGSERTFRDMLGGALDGYDADAQLLNLAAALEVMAELAGGAAAEPVFDTLPQVNALRRAVMGAMKSEGTNRVVLVQGPSGIGKTTAARVLAGKLGARVMMIEASDVWADKPSALLGAVLRAFGAQPPVTAMERLEQCQDRLNRARYCLVIDEAHHLGPKSLNTLKTLVNSTPGEFVLLAIPTLWHKLEGAAYQEARQLTTNRLSERVQLRLAERDLSAYFALAVPALSPELARAAGKAAAAAAQGAGNYAFARDVARLITAEAPQLEDISAAIKAAAERR